MNSTSWNLVAKARTFLFVPADRATRICNALDSGSDVVIVDFEDAVSPLKKSAARSEVGELFRSFTAFQRGRILVRINGQASEWYEGDRRLISDLVVLGLGGVMLPKAESASTVDDLARDLCGSVLIPLIESAKGLESVGELSRCANVVRLAFGHLDFQADLTMRCGPEETELIPARMKLLLASRVAGLAPPIDGVTVHLDDGDRLRKDTERSRGFGFGAKLCIHPRQVPIVKSVFEGTTAERQWAQRVLDTQHRLGAGAFRLDGQMIDGPVLRMARDLLGNFSHAAGELSSNEFAE